MKSMKMYSFEFRSQDITQVWKTYGEKHSLFQKLQRYLNKFSEHWRISITSTGGITLHLVIIMNNKSHD